MINQVK